MRHVSGGRSDGGGGDERHTLTLESLETPVELIALLCNVSLLGGQLITDPRELGPLLLQLGSLLLTRRSKSRLLAAQLILQISQLLQLAIRIRSVARGLSQAALLARRQLSLEAVDSRHLIAYYAE